MLLVFARLLVPDVLVGPRCYPAGAVVEIEQPRAAALIALGHALADPGPAHDPSAPEPEAVEAAALNARFLRLVASAELVEPVEPPAPEPGQADEDLDARPDEDLDARPDEDLDAREPAEAPGGPPGEPPAVAPEIPAADPAEPARPRRGRPPKQR